MITKAKVTSGFAANLEALKGRTFEFRPGLNILFGPNGCGKTTLLRILGAYCGTRGGWSSFVEPVIGEEKDLPYPKRFVLLSPGVCEAELEWDGTATFLTTPETRSATGSCFGDSLDGLMDVGHQMVQMMRCPSEGQMSIMLLKNAMRRFEAIPDITALPKRYKSVNDVWKKAMRDFVRYVKSLPRKGPNTLLIDEPERSLSIPNQAFLWDQLLPSLAKKFQVIVATHSPFALVHRESILMNEGYVHQCFGFIRTLGSKV